MFPETCFNTTNGSKREAQLKESPTFNSNAQAGAHYFLPLAQVRGLSIAYPGEDGYRLAAGPQLPLRYILWVPNGRGYVAQEKMQVTRGRQGSYECPRYLAILVMCSEETGNRFP